MLINILFLSKPIFDMFYKYPILDAVLVLFLIYYLITNSKKVKLTKANILLLLLFFLLTRSLLMQFNLGTFTTYIKIASALMMFIAAQLNEYPHKTLRIIALSYLIPLSVNSLLGLTGNGYIYWGDILTFSGTYYYKTDLAIAIVLGVIFFRYYLFNSDSRNLKKIAFLFIFLIAPYLIIKANSRMFIIVYGITLIFICGEYLKNKRFNNLTKSQKKYKFSLGVRTLIVASVVVLVSSILLVYNNTTASQNALNIDFENIFSEKNTQGRSEIWPAAIKGFSESPFLNKLFGSYLNADYDIISKFYNDAKDAHNNLIKITLNFGIIGLMLFIVFMFRVIYLLNASYKRHKNETDIIFILNTILLLFIFFNLPGMTQSNIIYTQSSWYAFYFFGLLSNPTLFKEAVT